MRFYEQVSSVNAHFLKEMSPISPKSLLRQASDSPLCLIRPARAMVFFGFLVPLSFPFSSTCIKYQNKLNHKKLPWINNTYVSDFNLDGSVVVGGDEGVSGGALSWDVQVNNLVFIVLHFLIYVKDNYELIIIKSILHH